MFDIYFRKRVLITGHTGFKGSWLAFILQQVGAEVMGFALAPEQGHSLFNILGLEHNIIHVVGDINDSDLINNVMQDFQPEYVFHLAAQSLVRTSYDEPVSTISTNVLGSAKLLDAVFKCDSVRVLVYITTDKCYKNREWVWSYRENDQLGGSDPYSASKAAAEHVFAAYAKSFFIKRGDLGAGTARSGNVVGGGDWAADRIIPDCIRAVQSGQPLLLRNPESTRPWQHVLEPLSGYLLLASKLRNNPKDFAGSWNFGPSAQKVLTVQSIAEVIISHLKQGRIEIVEMPDTPNEAKLLQLNCEKAHRLLGWYPRWDIKKTLEATAIWYKTFLEGGEVETITRKQIREYFPEIS